MRYGSVSTSLTPASEGQVGTPLTFSSRIVAATVSQFTNYWTVSDFLEDTAPDPIVQNAAELLGEMAGLTADTLTRNVIDNEYASLGTAPSQSVQATYLRTSDLRAARHGLQAINVKPMDDGWFFCVAHPYATYDLVNDPSANGLADIIKYNTNVKESPLVKYEDRGTVTYVAGCKVVESTNVYTQATPNRYRTYIFGNRGVGRVELEGKGPSKITDPSKQRFKIRTVRNDGNNIADPEGVIGAAVAYNFKYTVVVVDGPASIGGVYRYRLLDPASSIS
jgi:N4-gp56 family major capsid protein